MGLTESIYTQQRSLGRTDLLLYICVVVFDPSPVTSPNNVCGFTRRLLHALTLSKFVRPNFDDFADARFFLSVSDKLIHHVDWRFAQ